MISYFSANNDLMNNSTKPKALPTGGFVQFIANAIEKRSVGDSKNVASWHMATRNRS